MTFSGSTQAELALGGFCAAVGDALAVEVDPAVLETYRRDQSPATATAAGEPLALVRPTGTAGVQAAVRAAAAHQLPIVIRGAGSGLSGGANALDGCVILCLERMRSVEIDPTALTATAGPGAINAQVDAAAAEHGLWYPPDPASLEFSTVGGNVATNAGGLCCVKYGVTRDWVRELQVVFADGQVVRLGHRTRKGVVGLDLAGLLCGSEGTLGVVTEVTVALRPRPAPPRTVAASFRDLGAAGRAVVEMTRQLRPSLLEIVDRQTIAAVEAFRPQGLDLDAAAMLFAQSDAPGPAGGVEQQALERICWEHDAELVVASEDAAEGRMLLAARRLAYPSLERLGVALLDDVCVPVPRLPALLERIERIARRSGVTIATFGHAGDGNLHPTIVFDAADGAARDHALAAFAAVVDAALEFGGTATGEHGVGSLKAPWLARELGPALNLQRRIKAALDPEQLFNPGRAI